MADNTSNTNLAKETRLEHVITFFVFYHDVMELVTGKPFGENTQKWPAEIQVLFNIGETGISQGNTLNNQLCELLHAKDFQGIFDLIRKPEYAADMEAYHSAIMRSFLLKTNEDNNTLNTFIQRFPTLCYSGQRPSVEDFVTNAREFVTQFSERARLFETTDASPGQNTAITTLATTLADQYETFPSGKKLSQPQPLVIKLANFNQEFCDQKNRTAFELLASSKLLTWFCSKIEPLLNFFKTSLFKETRLSAFAQQNNAFTSKAGEATSETGYTKSGKSTYEFVEQEQEEEITTPCRVRFLSQAAIGK
jgi:hypothetical protein